MLSIGLIMILSVIGVGSYIQATVKSRDTQRKSDLNQMAKAVEAFYNDIGRYPNSTADNKMYCITKSGSTITDTTCNTKLFAVIDGLTVEYITIPSDPVPSQKYVYVSSGGQNYTFYTALENVNDKDLLKDGSGNLITNPWSTNCSTTATTISCNYKVTETGLIKSL